MRLFLKIAAIVDSGAATNPRSPKYPPSILQKSKEFQTQCATKSQNINILRNGLSILILLFLAIKDSEDSKLPNSEFLLSASCRPAAQGSNYAPTTLKKQKTKISKTVCRFECFCFC